MGNPEDVVIDIGDLSIIPRILLATDGTITHILEAYAGEPIDLVRLSSTLVTDASGLEHLGVEVGERTLRRLSLRRGSQSGRVFVHSDSVVVLDRLPEHLAEEFVRTGASLLKLLAKHRIGTFRENIDEWEGMDAEVAGLLGIDRSEILVARTYQIVVGGRPVAWVTERFPRNGFSSPRPRAGPVSLGSRGMSR